jgi:signal transduction histidine kinase
MRVHDFLQKDEIRVRPFASVESVEPDLIRKSYLVVQEDAAFYGILTLADVVAQGHNLVIDCCTEKKPINENEESERAFELMFRSGAQVLPAVDDEGRYVGSLTIDSMLRFAWSAMRPRQNINWIEIVGGEGFEEAKDAKNAFSAELFHNTRNPVQVILSGIDMLRSSAPGMENRIILDSIESSARELDDLITNLYTIHFERN